MASGAATNRCVGQLLADCSLTTGRRKGAHCSPSRFSEADVQQRGRRTLDSGVVECTKGMTARTDRISDEAFTGREPTNIRQHSRQQLIAMHQQAN